MTQKAMALLDNQGYVVEDDFLSADVCRQLLGSIDTYRRGIELAEIHRDAVGGRELRYSVIEGNQIRDSLPEIWDLYQGRVRELMSELCGAPVQPLNNTRAGVNVNIMEPKKSEYRWHYDRTPVTAIVYLNSTDGGQTELYPELRVLLKTPGIVRTQQLLDRIVATEPLRSMRSKKVVVEPKAGRLVAMKANRAWHSVRSVEGHTDRINIICAYEKLGATPTAQTSLDSYLYTTESASLKDPNYER